MEVIATVCCRAGSKRLPNKALLEIDGKSLIDRAILCGLFSGYETFISTDIQEILKLHIQWHALGVSIFRRPPELATDTASKWDVFRHIAKQVHCDILVDLDVGCPLRQPQDIIDTLEKLLNGDYDVVATAYEAERNPYFNMVEVVDGFALVCGGHEANPPVVNSQDAPKVYSLSPAVFAIRTDALWKYDHWSQARFGIHVIPRELAWDIDTPLDFEIAKFLMERQAK